MVLYLFKVSLYCMTQMYIGDVDARKPLFSASFTPKTQVEVSLAMMRGSKILSPPMSFDAWQPHSSLSALIVITYPSLDQRFQSY